MGLDKVECKLIKQGAYYICSQCRLAQHDDKGKPQCGKLRPLDEISDNGEPH